MLTNLAQPAVYEEIPANHLYAELPPKKGEFDTIADTVMTNQACTSNGYEIPLKSAGNSSSDLAGSALVLTNPTYGLEDGNLTSSTKNIDGDFTDMGPRARRPSIPRNVTDALPPLPEHFQISTEDRYVVPNPTYATSPSDFDNGMLKNSKPDSVPAHLEVAPSSSENPYVISNPTYENELSGMNGELKKSKVEGASEGEGGAVERGKTEDYAYIDIKETKKT